MSTKLFRLHLFSLIICLLSVACAFAQDFQLKELTKNVYAIKDTVNGDEQIVIVSDKGLVVLNSFWSETTAQNFKSQIIKALKRDDFIYLINMFDRLDNFGGNAAYKGIPIIGHKAFWDEYRGKDAEVKIEINNLINMWREKEDIARKRLPSHTPGSKEAIQEHQWINTCKKRADELETGFSLVLPTETYDDRMTLNLGNLSLNLIWLGRSVNDGTTVINIPELKLAIVPGLHPQHLIPYHQPEFRKIDVERWILVLEELLEGEHPVENVLCGMYYTDLWSRDRAETHLQYIRNLWNAVSKTEAEGKNLPEIRDQLSLEKDFASVKEMQVYKENGDAWIRPQHEMHVKAFFLQHKKFIASEIIRNAGIDSLANALAQIEELRDKGDNIYIDEDDINNIGYYFLNTGKIPAAVAVFELNTEVFPKSANAFDSYAEALMKNGDDKKAITNYHRSLELNPNNTNALEMLKKLEKK